MLYFTIYKYIIVAEDFEPTITWKHPNYFVYKLFVESKEVVREEEEKEYTYADGFKDKFIYFFSLGFGGFLFLNLMPLVSLPRVVAEHAHNENFKPEFMILTVTVGGILGTLSNIFVTRKIDFRRKPFLVVHGLMMLGFMATGLYVVSFNEVLAILFTLSGFAMYSQYPVYLNYPYELPKMNSQKLIIMFGMFWAFGYAIYTIFNFVWSLVLNHMEYTSSILFYLLGSTLYIIFVFTFPETSPKKK